ncbi:MAG: adenine phosphoribosyltransferase [Myxococcales bacterium]|nr:adenine phosphoribosyltransferase [Myxococcales bacterium]
MTAQPRDRLSDDARASAHARVAHLIRSVADFPKPGILFRDITPVLHDPQGLDNAVALMIDRVGDLVREHGRIDRIVGIESRGFLFGMAIAALLKVGFVPVRKPGKLPAATIEESYALEYGTDRLQLHADAVTPGDRVIIVDDLLATGGTAGATCALVERLGGKVEACLFLIELEALGGRGRLHDRRIESVLRY